MLGRHRRHQRGNVFMVALEETRLRERVQQRAAELRDAINTIKADELTA